jgi:NAD(P)-dependent dehydrogenase (short-subunit alcohol dehydrogenase family)
MRDRVVVVTGASAGLGRAIARRFAVEGSSVALLSRGEAGLDATATDVASLGGRPLALSVDVADWAAVRLAARQIEDQLGPIDVWINNAMTSVFSPFEEIEMDDYTRATNVNYLGFVHGTKAALEHMGPRDAGVIVQVSSALAFRSIPLQSAYCGSKHAIVGFTESLRTELMHGKSGIRVTLVHMPAMNTPQFGWVRSVLPRRAQPVAPIYQPEVGAEVVHFASDHASRRSYSVGASTVLTVLGNKIAPGLLDRYLAKTGYDAQQSDEPEDPHRQDNLYGPIAGDHGAHGTFDRKSHARSLQVWTTTHRPVAMAALTLASALLGAGLRSRYGPKRHNPR